MALLTDGAIFQTVVENISDQNRMLARVQLDAGARKLIKFYDMAQLLVALRYERDGIIIMESEIPTELVSDFQILDFKLNTTTRVLQLEIHRGDASIDGDVIRLPGVVFSIANVTINKVYFVYVGQNGSIFYEEDSTPDQAAILLWKVEVKDPIQDLRFIDLRAFFTRDDRYETVTEVFAEQVTLIRGVPGGVASLDAQGLVPLSQIPTSLKAMLVVSDLAARDALTPYDNLRVHVLDATADPTVASGWAEYLYFEGQWHKISERDSLDLVLSWENLQGKPSASVSQIDAAVEQAHAHENLPVLQNLSEETGELYYNNIKVTGGVETTLNNWAQAGVEKKTMVFVLPRTLVVGPQPVELEFPYTGQLYSVTVSCLSPTFHNGSTFSVERCTHSDYTTTPVWNSVLTTPMVMDEGKRFEAQPASFILPNLVQLRDHFRVNLLSIGYGLEGLVIQVTVQLS